MIKTLHMGKRGANPPLCRNCKVRKPSSEVFITPESFEQRPQSFCSNTAIVASALKLSGKEAFLIPKLSAFLQQRTRVFGLLIGGLGLALLAYGMYGLSNIKPQISQAPQAQTTVASTDELKVRDTQSTPKVESASTSSRSTSTTITKPKKQSTSQPTPSIAPAADPSEVADVTVSLNIDDKVQGTVTLPGDSNQCDVLERALTDGLISSLDMRYSSAYKSYGVYVINGIGDSNSVWWGYKVNGKSPPLGCSHIKVVSGDSIKWEYVKD